MTTEQFFLLSGLLHGVIALLATGANVYATHRRAHAVAHKDSGGLRVALAAELANLRWLYKDNLDAIHGGADVLVSIRMFAAIYRGNLGRIHLLPAEIIPALVAAYAKGEQAEAYAAAYCKAHGATAFSMSKDRPFAQALVAAYEQAAASTERALRAMEPSERDEPTAEVAAAEEQLAAT
jgi:hypothetical protein